MSNTQPRSPDVDGPEAESLVETGLQSIERLPEVLCFVEDEALRVLHLQIEQAIKDDSDDIVDLARQYKAIAEAVVENGTREDFQRAQIGFALQMTLFRWAAGRVEDVIEELDEILTRLYGIRHGAGISVVGTALYDMYRERGDPPSSGEISWACRGVLSWEDCLYLAKLPLEEALREAQQYLEEAGFDPDEFLRERDILR